MTAADVAVSGIIPTVGRADYLRKCLETVARQTLVPREVIIVHCADDPETQVVAADPAWPAAGFEVRYFRYPERNAAAQRNFAVTQARHPWLLLLDDDLELEPGWTEELLRPMLADPKVVATLGRLTNQPTAVWASKWWLLYHWLVVGQSPGRNQGRLVGAVVNLGFDPMPVVPAVVEWIGAGCTAIRRSAFEAVGGFAPYFTGASPGEDLDLGFRLSRMGQVLFVPSARSYHHSSGQGREPSRQYHSNVIASRYMIQIAAMGRQPFAALLHTVAWAWFQTVSEFVGWIRGRQAIPMAALMGRAFALSACVRRNLPIFEHRYIQQIDRLLAQGPRK